MGEWLLPGGRGEAGESITPQSGGTVWRGEGGPEHRRREGRSWKESTGWHFWILLDFCPLVSPLPNAVTREQG